jgi:hypothetical protein
VFAKNVSKIQWKDIIDNPSSLDVDDSENVVDIDEVKNAKKDLLAFDAVS